MVNILLQVIAGPSPAASPAANSDATIKAVGQVGSTVELVVGLLVILLVATLASVFVLVKLAASHVHMLSSIPHPALKKWATAGEEMHRAANRGLFKAVLEIPAFLAVVVIAGALLAHFTGFQIPISLPDLPALQRTLAGK